MEKSTPSSLLQNPYYFCESGSEASWKEVADAIGEGLHKASKIQDPAPKTLPEDLYSDVFAECKSHRWRDSPVSLEVLYGRDRLSSTSLDLRHMLTVPL